MQDQYADLYNLAQAHGVGSLAVGEAGLQLLRYGAGEARLSGHFRVDGILRGLGGELAGAFTTAARDAIPAGSRPYGLKILNTTTNRYEWNAGTDAVPNWQPVGPTGPWGTTDIVDAAITGKKLAVGAAAGGADSTQMGNIGSAFPTTGLYNGYRFTLVSSDGVGTPIQDFIYRADLDATYPWHFVGGSDLFNFVDAGSSTTSTTYANTSCAVTLPRPGVYTMEYGVTVSSNSGAGGEGFACPNSTTSIAATDSFAAIAGMAGSSENSSVTVAVRSQGSGIYKRVFTLTAAGEVVTLQRKSNGISVITNRYFLSCRPRKLG